MDSNGHYLEMAGAQRYPLVSRLLSEAMTSRDACISKEFSGTMSSSLIVERQTITLGVDFIYNKTIQTIEADAVDNRQAFK